MATTIIGIDAHKRSHTAVVLDNDNEIVDQFRLAADRRQLNRLLAWADRWPDRVFAIENVRGLGRLLGQQLVGAGETVVDVPATMTARTRGLSGHSGRKTDEFDARSVAIAGANHTRLRRVEPDNTAAELRVLLDSRWHLVSRRQQVICRLHDRLTELSPGGAKKGLSVTRASAALRRIRVDNPADAARRQAVKDLLAEWRWLNTRITTAESRVAGALVIHGSTAMPKISVRVRDRSSHDRCRRRRHRQVPHQRPLRLVQRHRPARRVLGRPRTSPPQSRWQPSPQQGHPHGRDHPDPLRRPGTRSLRPQDRPAQEPRRGGPVTQAATIGRDLPAHGRRRET